MQSKKIRYAVMGAGSIAQEVVLPAFQHTGNAELGALVTGDPVKQQELGRRYGVRAYTYNDLERCLADEHIDAVYIALPNHLHREYTERSAAAGVHILCEKPMAPCADDCMRMIDAARKHHVKLMIAYRLHFEEGNLEAIRIVNSGQIGEPRIFNSVFCQQVMPGNVRLTYTVEQGGGPVFDMGVYCINAARYLFRDEPTELTAFRASENEQRFARTEEMVTAVMRFPKNRLATFTASFGAARISTYSVVGTKGMLRVDPAYDYAGAIRHMLTTGEQTQERTFEKRDQFGPEIVYFSDCILEDREPEPSGEEGLADVQIVEGIYQAIETGRMVRAEAVHRRVRPEPSQEIHMQPVEEPKLVDAQLPSGKK